MTPFAQLEKSAARGEQFLKRLTAMTTMAHPGTKALRDVDQVIARSKLSLIDDAMRRRYGGNATGIADYVDDLGKGLTLKDPGAQVRALVFGRLPGAGSSKGFLSNTAKDVRSGLTDFVTQAHGTSMASNLDTKFQKALNSLRQHGRKAFEGNSLSAKDLLR
jgi:hypothetical protein